MDNAKLKQKAEDYAFSQWEGQIPWSIIQKAYYDGYRDCEKENADLEKELENLKEAFENQRRHNDDLVREIEELKIELERTRLGALKNLDGWRKSDAKLAKTKEIILTLQDYVKANVDQFLKEIE